MFPPHPQVKPYYQLLSETLTKEVYWTSKKYYVNFWIGNNESDHSCQITEHLAE